MEYIDTALLLIITICCLHDSYKNHYSKKKPKYSRKLGPKASILKYVNIK